MVKDLKYIIKSGMETTWSWQTKEHQVPHFIKPSNELSAEKPIIINREEYGS